MKESAKKKRGEVKVVEESELVERDGRKYEINAEEPFTGKAVKYFPGGKKHRESEYYEGNRHGKETIWFVDGTKTWEKEYWHGDQIGNKLWDRKGRELAEFFLEDGRRHSKRILWHDNGQKKAEYASCGGKPHGQSTEWYENGQKKMEMVCFEGEQISRSAWDEEGNLTYSQ